MGSPGALPTGRSCPPHPRTPAAFCSLCPHVCLSLVLTNSSPLEFSLFFPLDVHSWSRVYNLISPGEAAPGSKGDERMPPPPGPMSVPWGHFVAWFLLPPPEP